MGDVYTNPPQSRNEAILRATIDGTEYTAPPQSRIEDLLLELKEAIEQGGGTGEGDMKKSIYDSDNSVATAGGIKMFVNQKIGTLPQRVGSLETTAGVLQGEVVSIENTLGNLGTASTKNSTSVVTKSSDLVESGAVKDAIVGTTGWIGGNLLIFPYDAQTTTYAWGTVTVNGDGTITVNGTPTERIAIKLETPAINYDLSNGDYILSLENAQSGSSLLVEGYNGLTWYKLVGRANVDNPSVSISIDHNGYTNLSVYISIESGTTLNNVTLKPMISKRGGLFVPYHASVEDSLAEKADNSVIGTVEDGTTASQAYAVREHFIRNGAFCTVTQAISSGGTLTEGTNYTSGDVASSIALYKGAPITTGIDFNNLPLDSICQISAGGCSNTPSGNAGFYGLVETVSCGAYAIQKAYQNSSGLLTSISYRSFVNGTWSNWLSVNFNS